MSPRRHPPFHQGHRAPQVGLERTRFLLLSLPGKMPHRCPLGKAWTLQPGIGLDAGPSCVVCGWAGQRVEQVQVQASEILGEAELAG